MLVEDVLTRLQEEEARERVHTARTEDVRLNEEGRLVLPGVEPLEPSRFVLSALANRRKIPPKWFLEVRDPITRAMLIDRTPDQGPAERWNFVVSDGRIKRHEDASLVTPHYSQLLETLMEAMPGASRWEVCEWEERRDGSFALSVAAPETEEVQAGVRVRRGIALNVSPSDSRSGIQLRSHVRLPCGSSVLARMCASARSAQVRRPRLDPTRRLSDQVQGVLRRARQLMTRAWEVSLVVVEGMRALAQSSVHEPKELLRQKAPTRATAKALVRALAERDSQPTGFALVCILADPSSTPGLSWERRRQLSETAGELCSTAARPWDPSLRSQDRWTA